MKKLISLVMIYSLSTFAAPTVDIAILLDTSGSMSSLITQVRDGLWKTLNNLREISKNSEKATLRIALYEYGSGVVPMETNFIQQLTPLTTDHMSVAEKLFATQASGSEEYIGTVIEYAHTDLDFSKELSDFKAIIIAGNETIYQGNIDPFTAAAGAFQKDIIVNAIYAGSQTQTASSGNYGGGYGRAPGGRGANCSPWSFCPNPVINVPANIPSEVISQVNPEYLEYEKLAKSAQGMVLNISHKDAIPHIKSPYDDKIIALTEKITETYIPYGNNGSSEYNRMRNLDRQVRASNDGSYIGWGSYRSGGYGQTQISSWDLVSFYRSSDFDIQIVMNSKLPDYLQGKDEGALLNYIKKMDAARLILENEVKDLQQKREEYVAIELARLEENKIQFPEAFQKMLITQLLSKGFLIK